MATKKRSGYATLEDVARAAGVSRALASLALRGSTRVAPASRDRIVAAARRLGYRPNAMASQLASKSDVTIGLLINDLHNPFFSDVHDGVRDEAAESNYELLLTTGRSLDVGEEQAVGRLLDHRVSAVLLAGTTLAPSRLKALTARTPAVLIGRRVTGPNLDSVMIDDFDGVTLLVRHLLALGHRRIAHIDGGRGAGADLRRRTFVRLVEEAGLQPIVVSGEFTEEAGLRGVELLRRIGPMPTAIFAGNDMAAVGAMAALESSGYSVPRDVSVIGFDNNFVAGLRHVSLTTVDQPRQLIGATAVRMIRERLVEGRTKPRHELVAPTLVVRATTAPPSRT